MNTIRVYDWMPNGTNDIEIFNADMESLAFIGEATFGLDINKLGEVQGDDEAGYWVDGVAVSEVLSRIAVSPLTNGGGIVGELMKYFA